MLYGCGVTPVLSGNLGVPFSKTVLQQLKNPSKNVYFILEVSSFQLEKIEHFKPDYAVFTNISPIVNSINGDCILSVSLNVG